MSTPGPGNPFEGMPFFGDIGRLFLSAGPVNWDVARQMAQWLALGGETSEPNVEPLTRMRYEELYRVAELHVTDATGLAIPVGSRGLTVRAVGRAEWAARTLDAYRGLLEALAAGIGQAGGATPDVDPDNPAPDPAGELLGNLAQLMSPMLLGMQSGVMVGNLAQRALGQYDLPIPRATEGAGASELLVVPANVDAFASDWSLEADDVRLWVAISELTQHAVLGRPHVRERVQHLLHEYVSGFEPDASSLELRLEDVDPNDPDSLRQALGDPQALLGAVQTDAQRLVLVQLDALATAVVGYTDHITEHVGQRLVGQAGALSEALRRRRVERGDGEKFVERLFGLELGQAQYDRGIAFVQGVLERAGEEGLGQLWRSERDLPTPPEVDAPGLWLERIAIAD